MDQIAEEVIVYIYAFCDPRDVVMSIPLVCKLFYKLSRKSILYHISMSGVTLCKVHKEEALNQGINISTLKFLCMRNEYPIPWLLQLHAHKLSLNDDKVNLNFQTHTYLRDNDETTARSILSLNVSSDYAQVQATVKGKVSWCIFTEGGVWKVVNVFGEVDDTIQEFRTKILDAKETILGKKCILFQCQRFRTQMMYYPDKRGSMESKASKQAYFILPLRNTQEQTSVATECWFCVKKESTAPLNGVKFVLSSELGRENPFYLHDEEEPEVKKFMPRRII